MYFGLKLNKQDKTNNKNNSNNNHSNNNNIKNKINKGGFIYSVYSLTRALTFFISQPPNPFSVSLAFPSLETVKL